MTRINNGLICFLSGLACGILGVSVERYIVRWRIDFLLTLRFSIVVDSRSPTLEPRSSEKGNTDGESHTSINLSSNVGAD